MSTAQPATAKAAHYVPSEFDEDFPGVVVFAIQHHVLGHEFLITIPREKAKEHPALWQKDRIVHIRRPEDHPKHDQFVAVTS